MSIAKRAFSAWYSLGSGAVGAPQSLTSGMIYSPAAKKAKQKADDLVLYAAALGQKQGKLPVDMTGWNGRAWWTGDIGRVVFFKFDDRSTEVAIPIRFLEWVPAPAIVDEIPEWSEPMKEAA